MMLNSEQMKGLSLLMRHNDLVDVEFSNESLERYFKDSLESEATTVEEDEEYE